VPQYHLIKELLQSAGLDYYVRVGTVHAFQGLEFDTVIFDTVESPGIAIPRFTSDRWGTTAMRLLNVAITRARHKLMIVANMDYILKEPRSHLLPQIMSMACEKGYIRSEELFRMPLSY